MKMKALLALWLCLALTVPSLAQEKVTKELDSVYITPFTGCRLILVGKNLEKLMKENNLEVLKNKFIQDYQESAKDKDFPATAKNIIYLAGQDGRRRLKAVPDEAAPLKVEDEVAAFKNNLPPFHYTIYDLTKDYEYHIYVSQPDNLDSLSKVNCNELVRNTKKDKNQIGIRWARSLEIVPADTGFSFKKINGGHPDRLVLEPTVGVSLINSSLTPNIGGNVYFNRMNKYGKSNYQIGLGYSFHVLTNFQGKSFTSFYPISSYSLYYLKNIKDYGLGLSVGQFSTGKIFGSSRNGSLDKAWKAGIMTELKGLRIEQSLIFDKQKHTNMAITLQYGF